jgi:hypothetical protein
MHAAILAVAVAALRLVAAAAEPSETPRGPVAVIGAGDCGSPLAISPEEVSDFRNALKGRWAEEVQSEAETLGRLRGSPPTGKSLAQLAEEVSRVGDAAFESPADKLMPLLEQTMRELSRIPPSARRWKVQREATTLLAFLWHRTGDTQNVTALLSRVLSLQPDYHPDTGYYPPSFRKLVAQLKSEISGRPSGKLNVTTVPRGLPVFVGGRDVGSSPVDVALPLGEYEIEVSFDEHRSLARTAQIQTGRFTFVRLTRDFEGAVEVDGGPCVALRSDEDAPATLSRLASILEVNLLVTVQKDEGHSDGSKFSAQVFDVAQRRQVGEWTEPPTTSKEGLARLAHAVSFRSEPPTLRPAEETPSAIPAAPLVPSATVSDNARVAPYVLGGASALSLGGAALFYIRWNNDAQRLKRLEAGTGINAFPESAKREVNSLRGSISRNRRAAFILTGVGVASAVGGYFLYRKATKSGPTVSAFFLPSAHGTHWGASVSGSF